MRSPETTGPAIRTAERADLLEVLRIEREAFPQPWPVAAFERYLGEPGFLVADGGDDAPEVAGYVVADCVREHGAPYGHVKDLAVRADRRGEGIGATLLARALSALDDQGADTVKLEVRESNDPALGLYRSFGFEPLRTVSGYYDDGEDALLLVREL